MAAVTRGLRYHPANQREPRMLRTSLVMGGLIALSSVLALIGLWPENPQDRMLIAATLVAFAMLGLAQSRRGGS